MVILHVPTAKLFSAASRPFQLFLFGAVHLVERLPLKNNEDWATSAKELP